MCCKGDHVVKMYSVVVPIHGVVEVDVLASSAQEAIEMAGENYRLYGIDGSDVGCDWEGAYVGQVVDQ